MPQIFCAMQRFPSGLQTVLQDFQQWLFNRLQEQPDLLRRLDLAARYRSSLLGIPWLDTFKQEVADQLAKDLQASEDKLPPRLLKELQQKDYVWNQYVEDWLLLLAQRAPDPEIAPTQPKPNQGKAVRTDSQRCVYVDCLFFTSSSDYLLPYISYGFLDSCSQANY